jgi:uncharacterized protein (DUF488 family)
MMDLYTIGFTKKSAQRFFGLLKSVGAQTLIDVRLNNVSQLSGFAKRDDLTYFLRELCGMDYVHVLSLAPTQPMLDDYKKKGISWSEYESRFLQLIENRQVELSFPKNLLQNSVLLCSEDQPHHCHRRLVAEYLARHWGDIAIEHLV